MRVMTAFPRCPECNGQRVPMNYVGDVIGAMCMCPVSKSSLYGPWNAFDMDNWSTFTQMLVAERDRLRAEVDALKARIAIRCEFARLLIQKDAMLDIAQGSLEAARAEVEALRADAERYRWLRDTDGNVNILRDDGKFSLPDWQGLSFTWRRRAWQDGKPFVVCDGLDAAIDAARAAQGERG